MSTPILHQDLFARRHHGISQQEVDRMLHEIGVTSLEELMDKTIPADIRLETPLNLPAAQTETELLAALRQLAEGNQPYQSYIGLGYYPCTMPAVIRRNILENPAWYTAYTPYQAEISQGRLEMLLTFQTLITELTGMEVANASLLDEGTAAAEAMGLLYGVKPAEKKDAATFFVADSCFSQTVDVVRTRAHFAGIRLRVGDWRGVDLADPDLYGVLVQYPDANGAVEDYRSFIRAAHTHGVRVAVATDLLFLTLFRSPGSLGADVVVGNSQRFGVPMAYGGPHAAFFATREEFKRYLPGRLIGISRDIAGNRALRMALQTREQHIRREKATSNICTAQVLLAVLSAAYAIYHGPDGLRGIAGRVHGMAKLFSTCLARLGYRQENEHYFDTLTIATGAATGRIRQLALARRLNLHYRDASHVGVSFHENTTLADLEALAGVFAEAKGTVWEDNIRALAGELTTDVPEAFSRQDRYLSQPVFNAYHTEHELLRYLKRLESKDISLVHGMIPLGSCTMKLNAAAQMLPISWPQFSDLHPFAPTVQAAGYAQLLSGLAAFLREITGLAAVSFQPNSGAQGEYTGLAVIRAYQQSRGESHRRVVLIPASAHGTNPASAIMAGMRVVVVACDAEGNIDVHDLRKKAGQYAGTLSALMVTYPSTHGVFEEGIREICRIVHESGGQVYLDGANLNAMIGYATFARIGADICHVNLHKTFAIPHGGGGPGVGPVIAAAHLAPFLPGHSLVETGGKQALSAVSSAPFGSVGILPISYAYIALMGGEGLRAATQRAVLNANYLRVQLASHYPVLFTGKNGMCAHEVILDCRPFKSVGVGVEEVAKRLMDYSYHAPTVSFPVAGTLMIEPTESESLAELDRFCEAMIAIREEIREVETGLADQDNNVLRNAPHALSIATGDDWPYPYSRQKAAYPVSYLLERKYWPVVSRIDQGYGDRHLVCTCEPVAHYATA